MMINIIETRLLLYSTIPTNNLNIISKYLRQLLLYRVRGCVVGSVRKKKERKKERERERERVEDD